MEDSSNSLPTPVFGKKPSASDTSQRKVIVSIPDRLSVPSHFQKDKTSLGVPMGLTPEQAAIQAEVDPAALKYAVRTDERRLALQNIATDTFEMDAFFAHFAALIVGAFAVPLTKYSVDHAAINKTVYSEVKTGQNTYVYQAKPASESAHATAMRNAAAQASTSKLRAASSAWSVAGSTFQSVVATGKMVSFGNALEKIRAQQLRLGFFSIWKGTGAEIFWFIVSGGAAMSFQAAMDRWMFNREWYAVSTIIGKKKKKGDLMRLQELQRQHILDLQALEEQKEQQEKEEQEKQNTTSMDGFALAEKKATEKKKLASSSSSSLSSSSSDSNSNNKPLTEETIKNLEDPRIEQRAKEKEAEEKTLQFPASLIVPIDQQLPYGCQYTSHYTNALFNLAGNARNAFVEHAAAGFCGGILAVFSTYHAELVATKCVEDYHHSVKTGARRQFNSMVDCYVQTQRQGGLWSLYFGVGPVFLRAAAFWSLTFGIKNALLNACGFVSSNDYLRLMKRIHFDFGGEDNMLSQFHLQSEKKKRQILKRKKEQQKKAEEEAREWTLDTLWNTFAGNSFEYAGREHHAPPFLLSFAYGCAGAMVARDLGAVFVRSAVTVKGAMQHVMSTMAVGANSHNNMSASSAAAGVSFQNVNAAESLEFGRSLGASVPRRLPFSVVRTGLMLALFDSFRMAHTRRWCGQASTRARDQELFDQMKTTQ